MDPVLVGSLSAVVAVVTAGVAWLVADARAKTRLAFLEDKLDLIETDLDKTAQDSRRRISDIELELSRGEQARKEITNNVNRIDSTKASKELVDGLRNEIQTLKSDMDKRFDRIERLLESHS